ncbi:retrotransposon unclassified [Moniliophthora roreri]|nr:retrotransposon unclassified [Moniliophthora roreri]
MSTSPSPPPPPPPRPSTSMWEVKAMWLMAFSSCLTQSLLMGSLSSSHKIWLALKQVGEQKGSGMLMYWMQHLVTPFSSSSDVEEHLKSFQECFSTLKKLDFNVSSYLEAALLLATLSANLKDLQSWYSFICAQLVNKETKLSDIVFSMGKATHADAAIAPQSGSAVESALATLERDAREKGRYWCMNCRKDSHTKSYCTKPSGGRAGKKNKKKKGKGSKGKEKAHAAEDSGGGEVSNVVLTDLDLVTSIHIKFDHLSFSNAPISNEREYKWLTSLQSNNADPISIDNNGIDTPSALSASASSSDSVKPPSSPVSTPSAPKLEQPSTPTPSPSSSLPAQCPKAMPKSWPNLSVPPLHTHYAAAKEGTVIITSHVDDLGLFASSKSILDDFKSNLSKHVVISDKEISQLLDATVT